jgi:hypothetical protein
MGAFINCQIGQNNPPSFLWRQRWWLRQSSPFLLTTSLITNRGPNLAARFGPSMHKGYSKAENDTNLCYMHVNIEILIGLEFYDRRVALLVPSLSLELTI